MKTTPQTPPPGFSKGLEQVKLTRTFAEYNQCVAQLRNAIRTTEQRGNSISSYYYKLRGLSHLTIAEKQAINQIFLQFGISDWQGTLNED